MNIVKRIQSPTPGFFRKLRNISLAIGTIGGMLLTSPVALPAVVIKVAGYFAAAGATGAAISQSVTNGDEEKDPPEENGKQ